MKKEERAVLNEIWAQAQGMLANIIVSANN
jgi:hypothetical protein